MSLEEQRDACKSGNQADLMQAPPMPMTEPAVPANPSAEFISGYNDGYCASWLAPLQWVALSDYRNGWQLGSYDRKNNVPTRFHGYGLPSE